MLLKHRPQLKKKPKHVLICGRLSKIHSILDIELCACRMYMFILTENVRQGMSNKLALLDAACMCLHAPQYAFTQ